MKKLSLVLVLALVGVVFAFAVDYTDVPEGHWAYNAVMKATAAGLLQGFPDGTFRGTDSVTRYQLAEAMAKLLEYSDAGDAKLQELVFALTKKVAGLSLDISEVVKGIEGTSKSLSDAVALLNAHDADITALKKKLTDTEITVKLLGQAIAKLRKDLKDEAAAIEEIKAQNFVTSEQLDEKLSMLYTKVLMLQKEESKNNAAIMAEVGKLNENVEVIFDQVDSNVFSIMGLEKELAGVKASLDNYVTKDDFEYVVNVTNKLSADMFTMQRNYGKRIGKLEEAASDYALKADLDALKSSVNQDIEVIFDQIDSNVFDIMDLEKKVGNLEAALNATNEELAALKAEVVTPDQLSEKLNFLYKKINIVEANAKDDVETLKATIADLEAKLEASDKKANFATILSIVSAAITAIVLMTQ
ncbi:S-layer homology domain-containing protein [Kosmotoga olearia]|uniref:S-layer domain protein n=1 Tax=Kosmotoga olearia (strain ATCC BAA-1733 / DSM 21960 / TBF 19.5.1) TaxID=521045 RepID=C5CEF1_KOSOT|nr:S-layer homology domain-containing protein [Kosmotoga olearia]ACR80191.1 S-layer domain protein [Kosmotoga olearia TBF 19.5.1]